MEMSHRGASFKEIIADAEKDFRELMSVPEDYEVFFFQGGASLQFSAIPYNLLKDNKKANYLVTGSWSKAAIKEAKKYGEITEVIEPLSAYTGCPGLSDWKYESDAAYFHFCDNETIYGVEFNDFPYEELKDQTIVCDMSSNFCSRPVDWTKYGVVYAGAQKNVGPAGIAIVVVRKDLIGKQREDTPLLCDWETFSKAPTKCHNTPSCWAIYMAGLNFKYMLKKGLDKIEEEANAKSKLLYDAIDGSDGYYVNPVDVKMRSRMNVPFRVKSDDDVEKKFIAEATAAGLIELKGHRSVGGCRASIYNGMPIEGVQALVDFMAKFKEENP